MLEPSFIMVLLGWIFSCATPDSPWADALVPQARGDEQVPATPLRLPPLLGRPTAKGVTISMAAGERDVELHLWLTRNGRESGFEPGEPWHLSAGEVREFTIDGLEAGREYPWRLEARAKDLPPQSVSGRFVTQRPPGSPFRFVIMTDPHLPVPSRAMLRAGEGRQVAGLYGFLRFRADITRVFLRAISLISRRKLDFAVSLGDQFDMHALGFNPGFPDAGLAELAYQDYRAHLGDLGMRMPLYTVVGNWDGENGDLNRKVRRWAIEARKRFILNPTPSTYPEGGGVDENYYAWTWGDVLLVVLDVMGPTTTTHALGNLPDEGSASDWTLGKTQRGWLERTLEQSSSPYTLILIHHTVGGRAGDESNSAYGRGGGRAAKVGEQRWLHGLMQSHGVQVFFYGHDHVFTDMVIDGIHYTLPGSVGAPWKFDVRQTGYQHFDPRSGFAVVDVRPERLRVEFVDLEGEVFDSFEVGPRTPHGAGRAKANGG